jgi:hypothetical protein
MATKKIEILNRVPPGDRWAPLSKDGTSVPVLESLTEALEYIFQKEGYKEFHLSPFQGKIYAVVDAEDAPPPIKKYNIYGDR